MILREATVVAIIAIILCGIIGYGASKVTKKDDGFTEELSELVLEQTIEGLLDLPEGSMQGTVDFTPGSKEE